MQSSIVKDEGLLRVIKIVIEGKEIAEKVTAKTKQLAKTIKVSGFRPGKVPLNFVEKKHGQEIQKDVIQDLLVKHSDEALKEHKLEPALRPEVNKTSEYKEGEDFEYTLTVEVLPETDNVDYSKIKIEKQVYKKDDNDIEKSLQKLAESQKAFEPIKRSRKAKKGDKLKMDFVGKIDNEKFEGGTAENFELELGSGQFIPGFEDQLIGIKKTEEITVKVKFPDDYHSEAYAGKDAEFDVKVHDILESKEVAIDEEFAKNLGMESLDEVKEAIRKQLEGDFDNFAKDNLKKNLFDELNKVCDFNVPEGMLKIEKEALEQSQTQSNQEKIDDIEALALRRVRLGVLLAQIGKKEKVEITEDEIREAVMTQAKSYPGQEQQFFKYYSENPQAIENLKGPILENKVVDIILKKIEVSEKETTMDELFKPEEAQAN